MIIRLGLPFLLLLRLCYTARDVPLLPLNEFNSGATQSPNAIAPTPGAASSQPDTNTPEANLENANDGQAPQTAPTHSCFGCCRRRGSRDSRMCRIFNFIKETTTSYFKQDQEKVRSTNKWAIPITTGSYVGTQINEKLQAKYKTQFPLKIPDGVWEKMAMGAFVETLLSDWLAQEVHAPKKILNPEVEEKYLFQIPWGVSYNLAMKAYYYIFKTVRLDKVAGAVISTGGILLVWELIFYFIAFYGGKYAEDHADPTLAGSKTWEQARANYFSRAGPDFVEVLHTAANSMKILFPPYSGITGKSGLDWTIHTLTTREGWYQLFIMFVVAMYHGLPILTLKPVKILLHEFYHYGLHHPTTCIGRFCNFMTGLYTEVKKPDAGFWAYVWCGLFGGFLYGFGRVKEYYPDNFFIGLPSEISNLASMVTGAYLVGALFKLRPIFPVAMSVISVISAGCSLWRLIHEAIYEGSEEYQSYFVYCIVFGLYYYSVTGFKPLFVEAPLPQQNVAQDIDVLSNLRMFRDMPRAQVEGIAEFVEYITNRLANEIQGQAPDPADIPTPDL